MIGAIDNLIFTNNRKAYKWGDLSTEISVRPDLNGYKFGYGRADKTLTKYENGKILYKTLSDDLKKFLTELEFETTRTNVKVSPPTASGHFLEGSDEGVRVFKKDKPIASLDTEGIPEIDFDESFLILDQFLMYESTEDMRYHVLYINPISGSVSTQFHLNFNVVRDTPHILVRTGSSYDDLSILVDQTNALNWDITELIDVEDRQEQGQTTTPRDTVSGAFDGDSFRVLERISSAESHDINSIESFIANGFFVFNMPVLGRFKYSIDYDQVTGRPTFSTSTLDVLNITSNTHLDHPIQDSGYPVIIKKPHSS